MHRDDRRSAWIIQPADHFHDARTARAIATGRACLDAHDVAILRVAGVALLDDEFGLFLARRRLDRAAIAIGAIDAEQGCFRRCVDLLDRPRFPDAIAPLLDLAERALADAKRERDTTLAMIGARGPRSPSRSMRSKRTMPVGGGCSAGEKARFAVRTSAPSASSSFRMRRSSGLCSVDTSRPRAISRLAPWVGFLAR
jgi:hypothetical protein